MSSRLSLRALLRERVGPPRLELPRRQLLRAILLTWPLLALGVRRPAKAQVDVTRYPDPAPSDQATEPQLWIGHLWDPGASAPRRP